MTMDRWIERQLRRLRLGRFLERAAAWWAGFLFAFGSAVLIAKLLWPEMWPHVLWLGAVVLPVSAAAWWLARRETYTRREAAALLDRGLGAGGLLMTLAENPDPRWHDRLPRDERLWREGLPAWRPVRLARSLALPVIFALGACLVPPRAAQTAPTARNAVGPQAARELADMLEVLDASDVLPPQEQQQLREEIEQLAEETKDAPLTHEKWETVDALRERMQMRLNTAELSLSKARNAVVTLAQAGGGDGQLLTVEQSEQLQNDVLETLRKMAESGALSQAPAGVRSELERLVKSGEFKLPTDPEEQQELVEKLQEFLDGEAERLSQSRAQGDGNMGEAGGALAGEGNEAGRAGTARGPGDAPLNYGNESEDLKNKFKEVVLPPGFLDEAHKEAIGTSLTAPNEQAVEAAPRSAAREPGAASGGEAWDHQLRPRHRIVVRKYFGE